MALPAIVAFIARAGIPAAVKKFGTKAVKEAQKHGKDMVTKPTSGQTKSSVATKGQRTYRSGQRKGAATGAGLTALGSMAKKNSEEKPKATGGRTNPKDFPTYDKKTESGAAFRRAFKEANAKGQKTFSFEGRRYSTDKK
jgi:hypothetical protein